MALVRWAPFQDLVSMQDRASRLFNDFYTRPGSDDLMTRGSWVPPVDIFKDGKQQLVLKVELPSMTRDDIDITVEHNTLTLRGEKKLDREVTEEQYQRVERSYGSFSRSFTLPSTVEAGKISADYKDGVLTIRLPLREEAKPKQIKVNVAA